MKYIIALLFIITAIPNYAFPADVHLSTTGTRTTGKSTAGDWSNSNCYGTLQAAMSAMSGGDVLTIGDGTYTGATNAITWEYYPPSGPGTGVGDAKYTIVRARNIPCQNGVACNQPLLVIFDGPGGAAFASSGEETFDWVKFQGIQWTGAVDLGYDSDHNYFKQCAFLGSFSTGEGSGAPISILGNYNLLEDCVFYGQGRYKVLFYKSAGRVNEAGSNTCRRCVARHDYSQASEESNQQNIGTFCSYYNRNSAFLNTISIDGDSPAYFQDPSYDMPGSWYQPNDGGPHNMLVQGSIAINNAFGVGQTNNNSTGNIFRDVAAVKNGGGLDLRAVSATAENLLIYNVDWEQFSGWRSSTQHDSSHVYAQNAGVDAWYGTPVVNNTIISAIRATSTGVNADATGSGLNTYGVNTAQTGSITNTYTSNPIYNVSTNPTGSIKYPVRIEDGSLLATAGTGGARIGPRILYKLGVDGTVRGDTDWNTEQGALWPWPYEDWVKAQMASMPSTLIEQSMPSATRGFATATGKQLNGISDITLTSYIWEYLGNPIPANIYGINVSKITGGGKMSGGVIR